MTHNKPSNVAASVRQRLLNIIRETGNEATLVWTRYATERKTEIPNKIPLALTEEFGLDDMKSIQWKAFVRKIGLEQGMPELVDVLMHLQELLLLPMEAATGTVSIPKYWNAGGPWILGETEQ